MTNVSVDQASDQIEEWEKLIRQGMDAMAVSHTEHMIQQYVEYIQLLKTWNNRYNLTARQRFSHIIQRHLLDSLNLVQCLRDDQHCLDMGSGAGFPGLMLAIANPTQHWYLLDSNSKKIRFLRYVSHHLSLENVHIVKARVESFTPTENLDIIVCRAFSSIEMILKYAGHLINAHNQLLAMKGKQVYQEITAVRELLISQPYGFMINLFDQESGNVVVDIRRRD